MQIQWDPIFPGWLLLLLGALGVWLILRSYRVSGLLQSHPLLGWGLVAIKILALLAVLLMMAKPERVREIVRTEKSDLLVLVDASESMNIDDEASGRSRFLIAKEILMEQLKPEVSDQYNLKIYSFSSFLKPQGYDALVAQRMANGISTDIGGALRYAMNQQAGRLPAGIVLLSDGVHNTGTHPSVAETMLASRNVPVYAVGLGGEQTYVDVELNEILLPEMLFQNERTGVGVDITAYGFEGRNVQVRLIRQGITGPGQPVTSQALKREVIARQEVKLTGEGFRQRVEFDYLAKKVGDHHLSVELEPLAGEAVKANNQAKALLSVVKRQMRILLVEGRPRWDSALLSRTLRADPRFLVDSLTLVEQQEGQFLPIGSGFLNRDIWGRSFENRLYPLNPPLESYDCLIIGDILPGYFSPAALENIAEKTMQGELTILFLAGPVSFDQSGWGTTPIAPLIPVDLEISPAYELAETRLRITQQGETHPLLDVLPAGLSAGDMEEILPSGFGFVRTQRVRPGAMKLAEHPEAGNAFGPYPLIAFQRVGKGRSMAVLFEGSWLWALSVDEKLTRSRFYDRFWRSAVRFLISGRDQDDSLGIHLELERDRIARGQSIRVKAKVRGMEEGIPLRAILVRNSPDGLTEEVVMNREEGTQQQPGLVFSTHVQPGQLGQHQLVARLLSGAEVLAEDQAVLNVEEAAFERRNAGLNSDLLMSLARKTGGRYYDSQKAASLVKDLPESMREIRITRRQDLWNSLPVFLLAVLALNAEWIIRKWKDLN